MPQKAYLAAPFFNDNERFIYHKVISYLRDKQGYNLYVPMKHTVPGAWELSNPKWAHEVFKEDVRVLDEAEVVFVINHGHYSDSGTAWEAGYTFAKNKSIVNILVGEPHLPYSLMMINGCDNFVDGNFEIILVKEIEQK